MGAQGAASMIDPRKHKPEEPAASLVTIGINQSRRLMLIDVDEGVGD
jgi:hypothetical protein